MGATNKGPLLFGSPHPPLDTAGHIRILCAWHKDTSPTAANQKELQRENERRNWIYALVSLNPEP